MLDKPYELPCSLHAAQNEIIALRNSLKGIVAATPTETRHFAGPSPADEIDATIPAFEFEHLQELASIALMVTK